MSTPTEPPLLSQRSRRDHGRQHEDANERDTPDQPVRKRLQPAMEYVPATLGGLRHAKTFDTVERFCLFIGYPRSGHSLVGSLLDAHPNVVLAHELDALRYVAAGYRRKQLYWMILRRDAEFTRSGRRWTGFRLRRRRAVAGTLRLVAGHRRQEGREF